MNRLTGKTVLITGCSSGIGYTCAHGLKDRGYRVFASARQQQDVARLCSEGLEALPLDLDDSFRYSCGAPSTESTDTGGSKAEFINGIVPTLKSKFPLIKGLV